MNIIKDNAHNVQPWLEEIYQKDGAKAVLTSFIGLLDFAIPRLARQEITGKDGGPIELSIAARLQSAEQALRRAGDIEGAQYRVSNDERPLRNDQLPMVNDHSQTAENMQLHKNCNYIKTATAENMQLQENSSSNDINSLRTNCKKTATAENMQLHKSSSYRRTGKGNKPTHAPLPDNLYPNTTREGATDDI